MSIKSYNETRYAVKDSGETEFRGLPESRAQKAKEKGAELGAAQTFSIEYAENDGDIVELVPNEKVRVEYFNRAYILAQQKEANDIVTESNFQPQEGVYSLRANVAEIKERAARSKSLKDMSPEELLGNIPADTLSKLLELFTSQTVSS